MGSARLAYEETFDCVQCGYCLPACPTYITMEKETHSPRGRINLVKMAAEGNITFSELEGPINLCLGCRACEVVCPTNVQYGKILESAKEVLLEEKGRRSFFQEFVFGKVFPNKKLLRAAGAGISIYQKFGMQQVARKTKAITLLPEPMRSFEAILPETQGIGKRAKFYPAAADHPVYKIGYFTGCMMDAMFSSINTKAIKLLQAAGCEVTVLDEQTCCGALQSHSGHTKVTKELAKRNVAAFEAYDLDYMVNSIGGCGAMLVEYDQLFSEEDGKWKERAEKFSRKNVDISVILSELELPFKHEINKVVTYQPSCHLSNVQKRTEEPVKLLKSTPGIQYVELPHQHMCCGSAGIYNLINYEASMDILDEKMKHVGALKRKPDMMITTNPGCHLQMKLGVEREGQTDEIEVVHLVELLAVSCGIDT
ncbi:(Fe-S)-binding protein [Oceanobacillus salinisoli]|uniref:(Fe-S)-binding protein n=1 Tax=Oceanobacillus salinisoli TaxID=2678611 RepID=UPI0012E1D547|nr:(Fe-S)-binding protein [Oceanobacillus salinisoli]